jgi:hypothetical protein
VDDLSIKEYRLLMKSVSLREVDKQYWAHWQAFLNFAVKAEKGKGKRARPKYDTFEKFFDYKKELKKAMKDDNSEKDEPETISRLREYMKMKKKTGGTPNG